MVPPPRVPEELLRAWESESLALWRKGTEAACLLAIPLVLLFSLLDAVIYPEQVAFFCVLRMACAVVLAVCVAVLQSPWGAEHPVALGLLASNVVGAMIDVIVVSTGGERSPYYAGITMTQMAVCVLIPWPPGWAAVGSALLVGGYVGCVLGTGPLQDPRALASNLAFLVGTGLIGFVATLIREQLRWNEFESRTALAQALRHKSEFMAKMSHELRTPLHIIIGYADMLLEHASRVPEVRELVTLVRSRGIALHRLISDLLDYAKVEAGRMHVHLAPVRVDELVTRVAESFRPLVDRKRLQLETATAGAPVELVSDALKLEQILTNLVANAVKFTEEGGVRIEARLAGPGDRALADLVWLDDEQAAPPAADTEILAVLVSDTGIGIAAGDLPRLAADFLQLDGTAERFGGTGLGLSISKRLAQLLGGRIAVRSRPGAGSTFVVLLPVTPPGWRAAA